MATHSVFPQKHAKDPKPLLLGFYFPLPAKHTCIPPKRGNAFFAFVPRKSNPIIGKKFLWSQKRELKSFMLPRKCSHVVGALSKKASKIVLLAPISETIVSFYNQIGGLEFLHITPTRTRQHQHAYGIPTRLMDKRGWVLGSFPTRGVFSFEFFYG